MSQTVDVNILVHSSHEESEHHDQARSFIAHLSAGPAIAYVFWPVLLGYLRIVTHPSILGSPLTYEEATSNIANLIHPPHIRVEGEGSEFWASFTRVADATRPRGNAFPDAHLVALMKENGVATIWTADRDFRKFDGITVKNPFDAKYADGFG